jgi:uncharacterized protein
MKDPQTILITGATGLIGSALASQLEAQGHSVRKLSRSGQNITWDLEAGTLSEGALDGVDTVVHLAGAPIAQRWTDKAKRQIMDSRIKGTSLLVEAILNQQSPPAFISASGANFYGYQRSELVDETGSSGDGFLAEVCRAWEGAAQPLVEAGVRTVFMRTSIVLSTQGGALAKMMTPFKLGVGGRIGSGKQKMSWISLPDLVNLYQFAIENKSLYGPLNAAAPKPVTNAVFTRELGKALNRPTFFPLPASVVKTLFGEMGKETVLADLGLIPAKATALGFQWESPDLASALQTLLRDSR